MHLCEQPMNITRRACCQLVLLLNDTNRVPPCHPDFLMEEYNGTIHVYPPPVWLDEPPEVAEDHATFILGMAVLFLIAVVCTFTLNRLTKPKLTIGYGSTSNYDFLMWMPRSRSGRRLSMLVLLRRFSCRRPQVNRNSNISVVSSNIGLLPSYNSASMTPTSQIPPPPYSETQSLTSPEV